MFVDRHELTGKGGGAIETHEQAPEDKAAAAKRILDEAFGVAMGEGADADS
jgi:hypothetical protein